MIRFFGIMGLLGAVTFLVLLIISIFRKTPKQKWVIGILASVLCMSLGMILSFNDEMNAMVRELNETKEALKTEQGNNETLWRELKAKEAVEDATLTVNEYISGLFGEDVRWEDDVIVFIIPVEGETQDEIFANAILKHEDILEQIPTFKFVYSLSNKERFYFRLVDGDMKTIMEIYLDADGGSVNGTVGIDYIKNMD
jgi:hypothetical protein